MHSIGEVVKQFEFYVPGLQHPIKGKIVNRISEGGKADYTWSISHHYKFKDEAGVYHPSTVTFDSLEEAETLFRTYAQHFVADFEVRANEDF